MKGDYSGAAKRLAQDNSKAILAAVDATVEQSLGNVYNIKGYPTLKYFYKGKCSSNWPMSLICFIISYYFFLIS